MAQLLMVNPKRRPSKRRKTSSKRRSPVTRAVATIRRRRRAAPAAKARRYRRNPIRSTGMVEQFKNGAIGAAGAIGVDILFAKLPIPANFKTGMMAPAVRGLASIGLGMMVAKVMKNRKLGTQLAEGGITVALHSLMKAQVSKAIPLNGYDDTLLGMDDTLLGMEDLGLDGYYDDSMGYAGAANVFDMNDY